MDENHALAFHANVAVLVWGRQTEPAVADSAARAIVEHGRRFMGGGGLVTIVEVEAEPPSAAARAALSKLLRDVGGFVRRSVVVQEGTGFRAAMVRAVVTGLTLVARQTYPHQVFDSVASALPWLVEGLPRSELRMREADLAAAITELRRRFDAHRREPARPRRA